MSQAHWILTKLGGKTGMPVICSSHHPDYERESYDVQIGQACFERNWTEGRLVNIADHVNLCAGHAVFAFKESLDEEGINIKHINAS
tara:strand:- start:126 stop:386 length:261 start_codon:yes stop_codon:yes gene_type:complete